jgi:hypothetical protein
MPEPRGEGARGARAEAAFVGQIVKDPRNPPKTQLLVGYLGRSSEDGHTRLYLDPELNDYVEIPNEAILHTQASDDGSPLGGTLVWINRAAEVIHGEAGSTRYKASFLEGRITQDYLGQAAAGGAGQAAAFGPYTIPFPLCSPTAFPPFCPPSIPIWRCPTRVYPLCPKSVLIVQCPTQTLLCRSVHLPACPKSVLTICPSTLIRCPSVPVYTCPSVIAICPTQLAHGCGQPSVAVQCPTFGACPSAVDGCPSAPGGCTFDTTVFQGGTVVNPGLGAAGGLAAGGFAGGYAAGGYGFGGYGFGG